MGARMVSKNLVQSLKGKKLLGYVTPDLSQVDNLVIKQGKAAFQKIEKLRIKEYGEFSPIVKYFELEDNLAEAYEKISQKLSGLEQVCAKEYCPRLDDEYAETSLARLENWYKDAKKGIAVMWEESYMLNKEGYYKSYDGYPKVYRLEDAVRRLELEKEDNRLLKHNMISLASVILSPFIGMASERFIGGSYTFFAVAGTLGFASSSYFLKTLSDKVNLNKKIWSIEPLFKGDKAVDNLKAVYLV